MYIVVIIARGQIPDPSQFSPRKLGPSDGSEHPHCDLALATLGGGQF